MERIDKYQLGSAIIIFTIGSIALFELGKGVKQSSWLAMLIAMAISMPLMWAYVSIQNREPEKNLVQILQSYLGRFLGGFIAFTFVIHFAYQSMRNTRDFGDLMLITLLPRTPLLLVILIMTLLSSYSVYKGVEVFFRTLEFLFPIIMLSYFLIIAMFFITGKVEFGRLFPILENGITPILKEIPNILMVPFGQVSVFLMFWKYLAKKNELNKTYLISYLFVGFFLIALNIINITVLGAPLAGIATLPLRKSVSLIRVGTFLERFDPVVVLVIVIGLYGKLTIYYMASVLALSQLFGINQKKAMIPIGVGIFIASLLPANYIQHIYIGFEISHTSDFAIFQGVIPVLLLLVMVIRGKKRKRRGSLVK